MPRPRWWLLLILLMAVALAVLLILSTTDRLKLTSTADSPMGLLRGVFGSVFGGVEVPPSSLNPTGPKLKKTVTWGVDETYEPPAADEHATRKHTLVLDLDETLVHSVPRGGFGGDEFEVFVRPGAEEFLAAMAEAFDLVVFTASTKPYADPILDGFASLPRSAPRYYRDACTWSPQLGLFVKDLRILGVPLDRVRLLDNTPGAYSLQPQCGVPIVSWTGDPHDRELERTARRLLGDRN